MNFRLLWLSKSATRITAIPSSTGLTHFSHDRILSGVGTFPIAGVVIYPQGSADPAHKCAAKMQATASLRRACRRRRIASLCRAVDGGSGDSPCIVATSSGRAFRRRPRERQALWPWAPQHPWPVRPSDMALRRCSPITPPRITTAGWKTSPFAKARSEHACASLW